MMTAMTQTTDNELLARSKAHDQGAFAQLVERHKNGIVNYLTRLTGCRDRAEDFAQETFIRFYQKLHHYREEGHLAAYLFRIATNLVRSDERRRRRFELLKPLFSRNGHGAESGPQAEILAEERQRQVHLALASIELIYRAPLVLREIEGLSYLEIAASLELSEGTVKSRLHRGRQLLKEKLAPYWNGTSEP